MGTQVFGIKIILQDKDSPATEDTGIGLYNVAGENSEFRWIQNAVDGVSTWKDKMIVEGGIKSFSKEIDLKRGGATSFPGSGSVVIKNSSGFANTLQALDIDLTGLTLEVWVFNGATPSRYRTYKCEEPQIDGREFAIPFKGITRNANILNTVTSFQFPNAGPDLVGKTCPALFGKMQPAYNAARTKIVRNSLAEFMRVQDLFDETTYTNESLSDGATNPEIFTFPVIQLIQYNDNEHVGGVVVNVYGTVKTTPATYLKDTYLIVTSGTGKGEFNEVDYIESGTGSGLRIYCKSIFKVTPSFVANGTRSWVQLVKIHRTYTDDRFPCKDFLDVDGNAVDTPAIFLTDDNNEFQQMADFGFVVTGVNKNEIDIDGSQYDTDIDTLDSYKIFPVSNLSLEDAADLSKWDHDGSAGFFAGFNVKVENGLYANKALVGNIAISSTFGLISASFANDRDINTYAEFNSRISGGAYFYNTDYWFAKALKFDLPKIPENITAEAVYLGIKMRSVFGGWSWLQNDEQKTIRVVLRRFSFTKPADVVLSELKLKESGASGVGEIFDVPDFYAEGNDRNGAFYRESIPTGDVYDNIKGHTLDGAFEFVGLTVKDYNSLIEGGIVLRRFIDHRNVEDYGIDFADDLKIYELCIIVKVASQSMKEKVYAPAAGRIFNDTWGGRKTASSLMSSPDVILEHIARLQDYRDKGPTPPSGWGLEYASGAAVATVGYGAFDNLTIDLEATHQITDYEEGYTDTIKQSLCRNFEIANWQDGDGYERAIRLPTTKLAPVYTVTLDDVLDRNKIRIMEPSQSDIFSEPFVRFNKNPASGEYESTLGVFNTSASVYRSEFNNGIQNAAEAQALWQACHSLTLKTHQNNKPPTDLTDLPWANGPGAYTVALSHLQRWVAWQSCSEIEMPLHFNVAGSWQECTPINIVFSHQTNNIVRSALVEFSDVNPNPPYDIMLRAIMYA